MNLQASGRSKQQVIQDIERITRQPGFIYTLAFLCHRDLFLDPKEAAEKNWHDSLSYQELGFLTGLMLKQPFQTAYPSEDDMENQVSEVDTLCRELHDAYNAPMIESLKALAKAAPRPGESSPVPNTPWGAGDYFAEGIFYDGSGAYDFQYLDLAAKRYEDDTPWIVEHCGFRIETAGDIARQLKALIEKRLHSLTPPRSFVDLCDQLLHLFSFEPGEITGLPATQIVAFLERFSIEPGCANQNFGIYGDHNAFDARPILRLGDNHYFLPVCFTLAQSIYESPFYWMAGDADYRDISFANRGKATARLAYDMMVQVFGPARVFQDVRVMKNKSEAVTDIDVLAFVGNKAVVLQAKSKKLTQLSRRGTEDKLRTDFKAAIQDSYDQAIASRHAILDRDHTFLDSAGNEIALEESLDEAYPICLTSDNYPGLIRQVDHFLTRRAGEPYPIAVSLFDLDVLTFYLKDPFEFVFYQRQRSATADYYVADNEVALLAYHLKKRFWRSPSANMESVDASWAQFIDAHFPAVRDSHSRSQPLEPPVRQWNNLGFNSLLKQLKESRIPGFTDAVFMLYEMSTAAADGFIDQIEKTKAKTAGDGERHSFSLSFGKDDEQGISFICRTDAERLSKDMLALGISKKYQLKAGQWLSLGSVSGSSNTVDEAAFTKQPWKQDAKLEQLSKTFKSGPRMRAVGKIGRNDPCRCGSNLKFKKCCGR